MTITLTAEYSGKRFHFVISRPSEISELRASETFEAFLSAAEKQLCVPSINTDSESLG